MGQTYYQVSQYLPLDSTHKASQCLQLEVSTTIKSPSICHKWSVLLSIVSVYATRGQCYNQDSKCLRLEVNANIESLSATRDKYYNQESQSMYLPL